jgi:hypothetical protein
MPSSSFGGIKSLSESYAACSAAFRISSSSASFFAFSSASMRAFEVFQMIDIFISFQFNQCAIE